MCQGISCEFGKHGEEMKVWFGDPEVMTADRDSHSKIREFHKLPEITGNTWRSTPIECYIVDSVEDADNWEIKFDEGKPNWWDEDCDAALRSALQVEINVRILHEKKTGVWVGSPLIQGKAKVPWRHVGGSLSINSNATLAADALQTVGGYLSINSNATLAADALQTVEGGLYINSNATLAADALQTVEGGLYINSNAKLTAKKLKTVNGKKYKATKP